MLSELREKLKKHDRVEIAYKTGLSFATVNNIISGRNNNPTIKNIELLRDFIKQKEEKQNELSS